MSGGVSSGKVSIFNQGTTGTEFAIGNNGSPYTPGFYGLKAWTFDVGMSAGNGTLTAGDVLGVRIPITQSFTAVSLNYIVSTAYVAGSGTQGLALYNDAGTQIGTCPDQTTVWNSTGPKTAALTVVGGQSLALTAGTFVWVLFLSAASATAPQLARGTGNVDAVNAMNQGTKANCRALRQATGAANLPTGTNAPSGWNSATAATIQNFWAGIA